MDRNGSYSGHSAAAAAAAATARSQALRYRKSSRLGTVLRKLLGRKGVASHVGPSSPQNRMSNRSPEFITSAIDDRDHRTASLPVGHVSRTSALGSHAPLSPSDMRHGVLMPPRRRASMPSIVASSPEPFAQSTLEEDTKPQNVVTSGIGTAITTDNRSNRRSRSADALHVLAQEAGLEPEPEPAESTRQVFNGLPKSSATSEPQSRTAEIAGANVLLPPDEGNMKGGRYQPSFDFHRLATTFNQQEIIPLEERMMVAEVKLMDLEYAISKLQVRSPSPPSVQTATPRAGQGLQLLPNALTGGLALTTDRTVETPPERTSTLVPKSAPDSGSTNTGTVSTQPTAPSLSTAAAEEDDPFIDDKRLRPLSIETSLHRPEGAGTALRSSTTEQNHPSIVAVSTHRTGHDSGTGSGSAARTSASPTRSSTQRPLSLTSMSIDHFTTLVTLLKREQHARIRLEEEIAELRHDVWRLLYPSPTAAPTQATNNPIPLSMRPISSPVRTPQPPPTQPPTSAGGRSAGSAHSAPTQSQPQNSPLAINFTPGIRPPSVGGPGNGSLYRQRRWDGSRRDVVRIDDFHMARRRPSYEGATFFDDASVHARESTAGRRRPSTPGRQSAASMRTATDADDSASEIFTTPVEPGPSSGGWLDVGPGSMLDTERGPTLRFEIAAGLWGRGEGEAF